MICRPVLGGDQHMTALTPKSNKFTKCMPLDVGGTRSTRREPPRSRGGFANSFFYAVWSFLNVHKMAEINQFSNHRSLYLSSISVSSLSCLDFECRFLWISLFPSSDKVSRGVYCSGGVFLTKYVDVNLRANKSRKIIYSRAVVCPVIWVSDEFIRFFPFISTCLIYKAPHFDLGEAHLKTCPFI